MQEDSHHTLMDRLPARTMYKDHLLSPQVPLNVDFGDLRLIATQEVGGHRLF